MGSEKPRTIAIVTSSRADYGHLYWVLKELATHPEATVRLMVTGAHLSDEFGRTVDVIEADGFRVSDRVECLLSSDSDVGMAKTIGLGTVSFAERFARDRPDLLLLIADRYEMLAPANAALAMRIPIAHIEGGERSEGAIDQAVRNALTMMSHLHLATTRRAAQRIIAMGESSWRVHHVGAPSLDHLRRSVPLEREELESRLGMALTPPPLVAAMHPVTLDPDPAAESEALFEALSEFEGSVLFCYPNADAGGRAIRERVRRFCAERERARVFVNLEPGVYWSLLRHAGALVGNSSSGIMEAASLQLPAVDIGRRQQGRERAGNVLHAPPEKCAIVKAIGRALDPSFRASIRNLVNPYGDGEAAPRIVRILIDAELDGRLLNKVEEAPAPG